VCKPGALAAGRATGRPIARLVSRQARDPLPSWDRAFLPLPFARVVFVYGPPLPIAHHLSDEEFTATLAQLERAIESAQQHAEQLAAL